MDTGHLNIPKPEMDRVAFVHDIQTKLFLLYSGIIENSAPGAEVLKLLETDPRVQALKGSMISRGNSASSFETKVLGMWFLWAINEYGSEIAEFNLNKFLDSETIQVINTLWVLGIEAEEPIELENGIRIISIEDMPDSRDKEQYLRRDFDVSPQMMMIPRPKAAITCTSEITKAIRGDHFPEPDEKGKQFWASSQLLNDVALLLNIIEGVSCIPYFSTSYTLPEMPIGMFGGSGGGSPLYDIFGYKSSKLTAQSASEINKLFSAFVALPPSSKTRMIRVLSRLSQAKRRDQIEDKILDLGIALEMALLEDNKNNDQLSLSFRLRGSWLIAADYEERQLIYRQLQDIYKFRSQVAHSGALCQNDFDKIRVVRESFQEYSLLAEKIVRQLIYIRNLDWTSVILCTTK